MFESGRKAGRVARIGVLACLALLALCGAQIGTKGLARVALAASPTPVNQAEAYFSERDDLDNVRHALTILNQAVASSPQDYGAWWRIAEYDCYLARHLPSKQARRAIKQGVGAGRRAEVLQPNRPEGHFWTGVNEGLLAEDSSLLRALALIDPVRDEMQTVMKLDPAYQQYGAERVLGRLYYRAPFFKGGDKQLSIRLLEDCLRRCPNNSLTMLYLAESYEAVGRHKDARCLFEKILSLAPDPGDGTDLAKDQAAARRDLQSNLNRTW